MQLVIFTVLITAQFAQISIALAYTSRTKLTTLLAILLFVFCTIQLTIYINIVIELDLDKVLKAQQQNFIIANYLFSSLSSTANCSSILLTILTFFGNNWNTIEKRLDRSLAFQLQISILINQSRSYFFSTLSSTTNRNNRLSIVKTLFKSKLHTSDKRSGRKLSS